MDVKKITKAAKKDGKAGLLLARMYNEGVGVPQSDVKGLKLAIKASKTNPEAYNFVAYSYLQGYGVPVSLKKAEEYYLKGVKAEDGLAEYSLGVMYSSGILGKKGKKKENIADEYFDKAKAKNNCYSLFQEGMQLELESKRILNDPSAIESRSYAILLQKDAIRKFAQSAKSGCQNAQLALAIKYVKGDGIRADYDKAWNFLNKIDENVLPMASYCKGYMYDLGLGVEQDYWKAYEYFLKAHKEGVVQATVALGVCALSGFGCDQDYPTAIAYFKEAAEQHNPIAMYYIGIICAEGLGVDADLAKAEKYLMSAAEAGYTPAYFQLGKLCDKSIHPDNNKPDKCFEYYSKAVEAGYEEAKAGLAGCYLTGAGVTQDNDKAYREMSELAQQGNAGAMYVLGNWYLEGQCGLAQDIDTAIKFYMQSAEAGNAQATSILYKIYDQGLAGIDKDPVKAFEWKVNLGKCGDSKVYFDLAKAYESGIKGIVEVDGEMAAYWYAKCTRESEVKEQREKSANKLAKFAKDMDGNWDFKELVARRDKAKLKELKRNKGKKVKSDIDEVAEA